MDEFLRKIDEERARRPGGYATRCGRCLYWVKDKWNDDEDHPADWTGECHRKAPSGTDWLHHCVADLVGSIAWATEETANIEHVEITGQYRPAEKGNATSIMWPTLDAHDWCGEFVEDVNSTHDRALEKFLTAST